MPKKTVEVTVQINNTPEAVIAYIADVNNRALYLPALKSVTDVQGAPTEVGTSWRWTWLMLGVEFEGEGRSVEYAPGRRYAFTTEGGIDSKFVYDAEPSEAGTSLKVRVDFDVPESLLSRAGLDGLIESMKQQDAEQGVQNLKTILDQ